MSSAHCDGTTEMNVCAGCESRDVGMGQMKVTRVNQSRNNSVKLFLMQV